MSVTIRPLAPKDKPRWRELFRGYITFYKATVADEQIELTWQRLMAKEPDFHIALVAVGDDDVPVGLAHILFHRSTWSPTHYCYLEDLFVDPAVRAKGIGEALIKARIVRNLTQKELAERLSLAEQQVQRYEATQYRGVAAERLQQVADALNLRVHEIFTLETV